MGRDRRHRKDYRLVSSVLSPSLWLLTPISSQVSFRVVTSFGLLEHNSITEWLTNKRIVFSTVLEMEVLDQSGSRFGVWWGPVAQSTEEGLPAVLTW